MIPQATTFTQLIKEEICSREYNEEELKAVLSGFIKASGDISISIGGISLSLHSENSKIAMFLFTSFKRLYDVTPSSSYYRKMKLDKGVIYSLKIQEKVLDILEDLKLMSDGMFVFPKLSINDELVRNFIEGVFLASGSVNSPSSRNYHLQLALPSEDDATSLLHVLQKFKNDRKMDFKMIARKQKFILYLKRAEQIATFLSIIYAHNTLLQFENERIMKDYLNNDNRIQICYNANYKKTLEKAKAQIEEINYLKETSYFYQLSDKERLLCEIRLANQDESLTSLADIMEKEYKVALSKSGVNHLFKKIHEKYLEAKNGEH